MRWREKVRPDLGDQRVVTRFLFKPLAIGGEVRWLELAKIRQIHIPRINGSRDWINLGWSDE